MTKKLLLTIPAAFSGPALVLLTMLFYDWSIVGGFYVMMIVSFLAVKMVWFPEKSKPEDSINEKN